MEGIRHGACTYVVPLPLPVGIAQGFRRGYNTSPAHRDGTITWEQWLQRRYGNAG